LFRKTLVLRDGKIIHSGKTSTVVQSDMLRELYGVCLKITKKKGRYWPMAK
jgi:ABC-type cobalamin/Fe3+-siderophores transport system ATPase subunit